MTPPIYTGVGSRSTPPSIQATIADLAQALAERQWILRSGAAEGSDIAFERGADRVNGTKEIYLPWKGFNGCPSPLHGCTIQAQTIAQTVHPNWSACSIGARRLHGRNVHQVLGPDCDRPSDLLLYWTPGCLAIGGTRTAVELARIRAIPSICLDGRQWTVPSILTEIDSLVRP